MVAVRSGVVILLACVFAAPALAQLPAAPAAKDDSQSADVEAIRQWVEQLGHDHYLRRESATQKLIQAGPLATEALAEVIRGGELEVVERATDILTQIAISRSPSDDGGAWDALQTLASQGAGRGGSSAATAIEEIRQFRADQARTQLASAGIFVGLDEFVILAISRPRVIVEIDEDWQRDDGSLQWLRWLEGVEYARIKGTAVRREVLSEVTRIDGLQSIAIVDAKVDDDTLQPLLAMKPIDSLEFHYTKLSDDQGDLIAAMPIRSSLNLMGTGISVEKVEAMRAAAPGLQIDHKQGGFLGVTCLDGFDVCEISGVVPGSAAEQAGLIQGDIIVQIDDAPVNVFRDLQNAINLHLPGDKVTVKFRRGDKIESVQLELRRFEQP